MGKVGSARFADDMLSGSYNELLDRMGIVCVCVCVEEKMR